MLQILLFLFTFYIAFRVYKWSIERKFIDGISGRYVVVTGCDSGFGRRLTEKLLKMGVNVFAGCFTEEGEKSLRNDCDHLPGTLRTMKLDITNQKSVDDCYNTVFKVLREKVRHICLKLFKIYFQNTQLWALVNNAGFLAIYGPMDWIGVEEYEQSINVNLIGAIR